jgi:hypothetical protein
VRKILEWTSVRSLQKVFAHVLRPLWPWVVAAARSGRLRQEFKISDGLGTMTHCGPNTIITGVTTADDNDVFAFGTDIGVVLETRVYKRLGV